MTTYHLTYTFSLIYSIPRGDKIYIRSVVINHFSMPQEINVSLMKHVVAIPLKDVYHHIVVINVTVPVILNHICLSLSCRNANISFRQTTAQMSLEMTCYHDNEFMSVLWLYECHMNNCIQWLKCNLRCDVKICQLLNRRSLNRKTMGNLLVNN